MRPRTSLIETALALITALTWLAAGCLESNPQPSPSSGDVQEGNEQDTGALARSDTLPGEDAVPSDVKGPGADTTISDTQPDTCVPDCVGKECGGSCGECPDHPQFVCEENQCVCVPDCQGKDCGPDGCGGICGQCEPYGTCCGGVCLACFCTCCNDECCPEGEFCIDGECGCPEDCFGFPCGGDFAGGCCDPCGYDLECAEGTCLPIVCEPDCADKECGDNGCGGDCGDCGEPPYTCNAESACVCECEDVWQPVCDVLNNKTYPNWCEAACAGVTVIEQGVCGSCHAFCTDDEWAMGSFCGTDGMIYDSFCELKCADGIYDNGCATVDECGEIDWSWEPDPMPCLDACPADYDPVCMTNGETYWSLCCFAVAMEELAGGDEVLLDDLLEQFFFCVGACVDEEACPSVEMACDAICGTTSPDDPYAQGQPIWYLNEQALICAGGTPLDNDACSD